MSMSKKSITSNDAFINDDLLRRRAARNDDVIIRGGYRIDLIEIERALLSHPLVRDAGAFGAADPELGQRVAAAVLLDNDADDAAIDHILSFISTRLAAGKVPELLVAVDAVPRDPLGEVDRDALAEAVLGRPARRDVE
jgi:acyl-CoA synthetase (AMP-forming)/AMP-acid ligase II